jgi:hemerythrin superfamily protein
MNAIEFLTFQHEQVSKLFDDFESTNEKAIADRIFKELEIHTQLEEQIFYPAVQAIDNDLVVESIADHDMVKDIIEELRDLDIDDEEFQDKFQELRASVEDHVAVEETEMFPEVESRLANDLDRLGADMERLNDQLKKGKATRTTSA